MTDDTDDDFFYVKGGRTYFNWALTRQEYDNDDASTHLDAVPDLTKPGPEWDWTATMRNCMAARMKLMEYYMPETDLRYRDVMMQMLDIRFVHSEVEHAAIRQGENI